MNESTASPIQTVRSPKRWPSAAAAADGPGGGLVSVAGGTAIRLSGTSNHSSFQSGSVFTEPPRSAVDSVQHGWTPPIAVHRKVARARRCGKDIAPMATIGDTLDALFSAERSARALHATLRGEGDAKLLPELRAATAAALALEDEDEATIRLVRLALLLGDLEGAEVVDLLIDILGGISPEARIAAGEALEGLAFDRFKEVALGIERALARLPKGSPALTELPFLLAEVGEPGCAKLLGRFLQNEEGEVVASAIEAIAELGDPAAIPFLAKLERDGRQVQLDDEEGGERVSIADLAHEAREILEEMASEAAPAPPPPPKKGRR
jgi:HEAT repeat protein